MIQSRGRNAMPTIGKSLQCWKHDSPADWEDWRWQLRHCLHGDDSLVSLLREHGGPVDATAVRALVKRYRFFASPYYLSLVDWDDPGDPIRRQCIPDIREMADTPGLVGDPFEESGSTAIPGVVHRFPDRVLLMATTNCAVACRHCTRKNTLETTPALDGDRLDQAIDYISGCPKVREVLVSGGDPLLLDTARLDDLLGRIEAVPHVEVVRIGTRVPVVLPMRVDSELVAVLGKHRPLWVNTQFNHPRELTGAAMTACSKLTDAGIPVSNQCVLLKGINDDLQTMRELCTTLQRNLIRPYYVFQCDPIAGIAHFRTEPHVGGALQEQLRGEVGGLCLPCFVADIPGARAKTPLQFMQTSMRNDMPIPGKTGG
jgi:lysine 2,3-aminomutase